MRYLISFSNLLAGVVAIGLFGSYSGPHEKHELQKWRKLKVTATAYVVRSDLSCQTYTGLTATGTHPHIGTAAVDPKVIPFGSRLSVPGYGAARAEDTGGSIVGRRIDLAFNTCKAAYAFGVRSILISYLPPRRI